MAVPRSEGSISHRYAHDLFRRRHAFHHLADTAHSERAHDLLDGFGLELGRRSSLEHALLQILAEAHDLVERDAALVPGIAAGGAADSLHDRRGFGLRFAEAYVEERLAFDLG